jgi:hypothetical protein
MYSTSPSLSFSKSSRRRGQEHIADVILVSRSTELLSSLLPTIAEGYTVHQTAEIESLPAQLPLTCIIFDREFAREGEIIE